VAYLDRSSILKKQSANFVSFCNSTTEGLSALKQEGFYMPYAYLKIVVQQEVVPKYFSTTKIFKYYFFHMLLKCLRCALF